MVGNAIGKTIAAAVGVAAAYGVACWVGLSLDISSGAGSVWPASGLLFGLLLVTSRRWWWAITIGALVGGVAANLVVGFDVTRSVGYVLVNIAEAWLGSLLILRLVPDAVQLRETSDVFWLFGLSALVAAGICAPVAATLASLTGHANWFSVWRIWWMADATGILIVMPVVLTSASRFDVDARPRLWMAYVEAACLIAAVIVASWWVFAVPHSGPLGPLERPITILPLVAVASMRFGPRGAAWAMLLCSAIGVWGTHLGLGFFALPESLPLTTLVVQSSLCMMSLIIQPLATAVASARGSARAFRELAMQLQSARDAERSLLSHELHDDIAQKLAALKMHLELGRRLGPGRTLVTNVQSVAKVDDLIADVRQLSHSLRPAPFEEGHLIPALKALAKSEARRAGLHVLVDAPHDDVRLSRDAELACYRVVREAVSNIIKHAQARHVALSVLPHAHAFAVRVSDDGRGFDVGPATRRATVDGHLGLVGMQERLREVGGTLTIRSKRGSGTVVECHVPLGAAA